MGIQQNEKLNRLINSLSKDEKLQFEKFIKKNELEGSLFSLFIALQKEDNTTKLGSAYLKRQLYNTLLSFLETFRSSDPIDDRVISLIKRARVLYESGMYKECNEVLEEAQNIAGKYEMFLKTIEICDIALSLISKIYTKNIQEQFDKIIVIKVEALEKYANQTNYYKFFLQINNFFTQYQSVKTKENIKAIDDLIAMEILQNYSLAKTFYSRYYYFVSHQLYAVLKGEDAFQIKSDHLQLWEANPQMKEKAPSTYFNILSIYMLGCQQKHLYQEYANSFKSAQKIIASSENDKINFIYRLYKHQVDILLKRGELSQLIQLTESTVKKLSPVFQSPVYYSRIYTGMAFSLCLAYFLGGENKKAAKQIHAFLNTLEVKNEQWQFLFYALKLLQLMVLFELKDFNLLADMLKSNRMYLQRHHVLSTEALLFINHLNNVSFSFDKEDVKEKFSEFKNNLLDKSKQTDVLSTFGFDIFVWIESKIQSIAMEEVFKKKAELEYPEIFSIEVAF